ncbi:hypothetical protein RDWZM_008848 [Blomia tropicalis]|uniref:Pyrroline-5-carboxylate reductase n=1 Tax=Blomia tropicalis TaxID=40697 RepID=A0A9Q0RLT7_BLOTA|nr:hypothetical protein RDWZM_008848 [Blomia tropicalis]
MEEETKSSIENSSNMKSNLRPPKSNTGFNDEKPLSSYLSNEPDKQFKSAFNSKVIEASKSKQSKSATGSFKTSLKNVSSLRKNRKSSSKLPQLSECRIGFLGAGKMTESIVRGLLKENKVKPRQLYVSARTNKNLDAFRKEGLNVTTRSYDIFGRFNCDLIFLCVHGFVVRNCYKMGGTRPVPITTNYIPNRQRKIYILSMINGIPLEQIKTTLLNPETIDEYKVDFHRLVLNTNVAYGLGYGALDIDLDSKQCSMLVRDVLQSIARLEHISCDMMDASVVLMGNALAFVYFCISSLAEGGFKIGLNKITANKLAAKTLLSASWCLLESQKNPIDLRDDCAGPNGPSIFGIAFLDKKDCAGGIQSAIEGSFRRNGELVEMSQYQPTK